MGKAPKSHHPKTISTMRKILGSLDARFPIVDSPNYATLVNYSALADEPIHRWFHYREGYSTKLVEALLQEVPKGKLIVDPFCGAGTTLLVSRNCGYPSLGIDANPLSTFVARVKTRYYEIDQLRRIEEISSEVKRLRPSDAASAKPKLEIIDKIFLPEVLRALLVLKYFIDTHFARHERDFLFLAWLSILEKVSNVFKEGNGIKYRNRKRTPSGYIDIPIDVWQQSLFPEDKFDHVIKIFLERVHLMVEDARLNNHLGEHEPKVFDGDALSLDDFVGYESAGLVAFSPPYVNNFNYFKTYKIELWMGGFVSDYAELNELTQHSLRSHVETRLIRESDSYNWYPEQLDVLIDLIDLETLWTPRILSAIKGYFYDMRKVLESIFDGLESGGRCAITVGNSAYGSVLIPTDTLLAEMAVAEGYEVERIAVARHLTTSSQQKIALEPVREYLRESIVFLKKTKTAKQPKIANNGTARYRYVGELPRFPRQSISTIYVIKNEGLTDLTHIIHKYPGKFIPHVPRWAIEKYLDNQPSKVILDPFCGSGTSLVEAQLAGHTAYGIDIDPLARLISKVKTTPIDSELLKDTVRLVDEQIKTETHSTFLPTIETLQHWFSPLAIEELGVIRSVIEQWRNIDIDLYDFLVICFSAIIRRVSNADNQSLKTYVSGTYHKIAPPVKPTFAKILHEYAERIIQFGEAIQKGGKTTILNFEDARHFADEWINLELPLVDMGITSPPYIKSIDYIYNQMAEYFWIGDLFGLENQEKQNAAKRKYIGTEKISAEEYKKKTFWNYW